MSALNKNPFLVGFGVVMVLGVGALGYLTYTAAEEHSTARSEYDDAERELNRLKVLRPFPAKENLDRFIAQKQELQGKVNALQQELAEQKYKIEETTASAFQVKLRDTVGAITARTGEANVTLPDKFYLGFNQYQTEPPKAAAAPALQRQLKAIESVMNLVLDTRHVEIKELTRQPLKEEQPPPAPAVDAKGKPKAKKEESGRALVEKDTFTLKFSTTQENFNRILNGLVTHKEQFFIPRYIVVLNDKQDAPPKVANVSLPPANFVAEGQEPPPGATPAASAAPEAPKLEYVFGKELVEVTMDIELVDVAEPAPPAAEKTANRK